jgi:hypothetical protein
MRIWSAKRLVFGVAEWLGDLVCFRFTEIMLRFFLPLELQNRG